MIIKAPKGRTPLLVALALLCIVGALSINKQRVKAEAFTVIDTVMAQDWGFASVTGLLGISNLSDMSATSEGKMIAIIKGFPDRVLARIPEILYAKITGFPDRPALERIDIDIKFEEYKKILEDRKRGLKDNVLTNPQEVPAKIRYKGKVYKAKIRLKGDLYTHWRSKIRMSFRVSLKGKNTIKGFKRFSLHKPGDRQYPYDQIFQKFVRESGVLSARHDYVKVFVNGEKWGVMNIEEHMSKELLEKQEAKESIILKWGNERKWHYSFTASSVYPNYRLSSGHIFVAAYQENKTLVEPLRRGQYSYVSQKFLDRNEHDIIDTDSFSRAAIASALWNNFHTLANANIRFYFNPYILKLEPITTDQGNFREIEDDSNPLLNLCANHTSEVFKDIIFSPQGQERFKTNLQAVLTATEKLPEIYEYYQSFFPSNFPVDLPVLMGNAERVRNSLETGFKCPEQNIEEVPRSPVPPTAAQAADFPAHIHARHYDDGRLLLVNLLDVPVRLEAVLHGGKALKLPVHVIPPYTKNNGHLMLKTDKTGWHDARFTVKTSYQGHIRETKTGATLLSNLFNPLEVSQAGSPPSFIQQQGENFVIEAGQWTVHEPLIIEGALTIEPGADLQFAPDAYLIIKGALTAEGSQDAPIIFKPTEKNWKGLYVIEAQNQSVLRHVIINDTNALQDGLLSLTGGVTFYKSPVLIEDTQILGTIAEDALNIIKSEFVIKNSAIANTFSDAFDGDFSNGKIISSKVYNVGGDAIDFSGSRIFVDSLTANNIHDKVVSAGEGSSLTIRNSHFDQVGVGIASKDGSHVTAEAITVSNYKLHAAMTYVKKDIFGAPELKIFNIVHNGDAPFSRQKKTKLFVDDKLIKAEKIDVKKLYDSEVMKK